MNRLPHKKIIIPVLMMLFLITPPVFAAAPDGSGPWADSVFSSNQGLMKNGLTVPVVRSDTSSALGIAENDTVDGHFYSLGFGGWVALGFDNGISNGAMIVESTNPGYPSETAKVEMSEDGVSWVMAGTVTQDGTVDQPEAVSCAKYVRITDTSTSSNFPDDIADGYDVDGVRATGDACTPTASPSPTSTPTIAPTPTPSDSSSSSSTTSTASVTSTSPGFPDAGEAPCTASTISTVPSLTQASRVSPTSIFISWGPDAGLTNFVVQYGFQNGNLQFSTNVSGFSTTIGGLPANQSIWVQIAATDKCAVGNFGGAVLVGGTVQTNSPGFPNTGNPLIPRLPDTGIGPDENWSITSGLYFIFLQMTQALNKL